MISRLGFVDNLCLASDILTSPTLKGGSVVECGTWRGGMSAGLVSAGGPDRGYYFFDSFAGLPPAQNIDGEAALTWQAETKDNCSASYQEFVRLITTLGVPPFRLNIYKGYFEQTLPDFDPKPVALLRLDGDWYDSTMICLEKFWPYVLSGGVVIIDDYYAWDGCSRAVHDFLSKRQLAEPIRNSRLNGVAYIRKR